METLEALSGLSTAAMTLYLLIATVLVFIMHAGFSMLEAGFTRKKNAANIIGKNLMTIALGTLVYWAIGWGLMYGYGSGFEGEMVGDLFYTSGFFLSTPPDAVAGVTEAGELTHNIPLGIDFAFQAMFAATAATIVSGAVAERMKFGGYVIVAVVMTGIIYPIVGAWTWGGGFLDQLGFSDFAGSTIVHMTGGVAALVAAAILGPRIGKFTKDGRARGVPGHSIPMGALGTLLLFFGWFGFNGGSVLALDGPAIASVIVTTALAGSAGGFAAGLWTRGTSGKWDVAMMANGILAGLVGITAGADSVSNISAIAVGLIAGVLVALSVKAIDGLRIDDPVGAVSVHGTCGILGTLWVAIGTGDWAQLGPQVIGILAVAAWVAIATAVLFFALKAMNMLRVPEAEELEGLDVPEHGASGYAGDVLAGVGGARGESTV